MLPEDPAPIRPRLTCPTWCEYQADPRHFIDYEAQTPDHRLLVRTHALTSWQGHGLDLTIETTETADPDGANPLLDPPAIGLYGIEEARLTSDRARDLAAALLNAADRLDSLAQA